MPSRPMSSIPGFLARHGVFALTSALFIGIRLPLLLEPSIWKGWHSDAAILGLMGKRMLEGELAFFFWGQNFLGPLTSAVVAAWSWVLSSVVEGDRVWPLALRLATMSVIWGGIVAFRAGIRLHDARAAELTALFLALGPPVLYRSSLVALGPEMVFLIGGVLFWMVARHLAAPPGAGLLDQWEGRFAFGVIAGIGWWMNQGIVFFLVGTAWVLCVRTEGWRRFRSGLAPAERLAMRGTTLGWRPLTPAARAGLLAAEAIPLTLLALYLARDLVWREIPVVFLHRPVAEPVALLRALHLAIAVSMREPWTRPGWRALRGARRSMAGGWPWIAGFLVGWSPVWVGGLLGWYERTYTFGVSTRSPSQFVANAARLATELAPQWLGVGRGAAGIAGLAALLAAVSVLAIRNRERLREIVRLDAAEHGILGFAVVVTAVNVVYFAVTDGRASKLHYLMSAIPMIALLAASGIGELARARALPRRASTGLAVVAAIALAGSALAAAVRFDAAVAAEPDPREILRRIDAGGWTTCYADYWVAYKLQFLSAERIRFVPWSSQDRNRAESARLRASSGPKCWVGVDGSVSAFPPPDAPR